MMILATIDWPTATIIAVGSICGLIAFLKFLD